MVEEGIPDAIRHFRHGQNIVLTFLIALDTDAIVKRVPTVPNRPESARRELVQLRVGVDSDHQLKQLRPSLALVVTPERLVTAFL